MPERSPSLPICITRSVRKLKNTSVGKKRDARHGDGKALQMETGPVRDVQIGPMY